MIKLVLNMTRFTYECDYCRQDDKRVKHESEEEGEKDATAEGKVHMTIRALVIESAGRRILVDTCLGNDKQRPVEAWSMRSGPFLDDLTVAGFPPESIDTVLCTHLHVDHVGWNTKFENGRWVPTFPNARYLFNRVEFEHWRDTQDDATEDMFLNVQKKVFLDSVKPVVDAGATFALTAACQIDCYSPQWPFETTR